MGKCNAMKDKLCIEIVYVFDVVTVVERFIDLDFFLALFYDSCTDLHNFIVFRH